VNSNLRVVETERDLRPAPSSLKAHAKEMERQARERESLKLGMPKVERLCQPGSSRFWVLGGRPGDFKTVTAWNWALNLALLGRRVLVVSLDMVPPRLALMALARFSGLEHGRITLAFQRDGVPFSPEEQARFDGALAKWHGLESRLAIHGGEEDGWGLRDVLALIWRLTPEVVVVDHLQLLAHNSLDLLNACLGGLWKLTMGKKYHPFVVAISTLNREIDKDDGDDGPRMPRMSDLWGGAAIEHAADVVAISRKQAKLGDESPVSIVDLFVLKNRDGPFPAVIALEANGPTCCIAERYGAGAAPPHWSAPDDADEPGTNG